MQRQDLITPPDTLENGSVLPHEARLKFSSRNPHGCVPTHRAEQADLD